MLLMQNAEPSVQLLKALEDVTAITKTLEEERVQHQQEVNPENFSSASFYCQKGDVSPGRADDMSVIRFPSSLIDRKYKLLLRLSHHEVILASYMQTCS